LHQSRGPLLGYSLVVEIGLRFDNGLHEVGFDAMFPCCVNDE